MTEEVRQRLLVAAVLIPLIVAAVWAGGLVFLAGIVLLAGVGSMEYVGLLRGADRPVLPTAVVAVSVAFPVAVAMLGASETWRLAAALVPLTGAWALVRLSMDEAPVTATSWSVFGMLYVGGLLSFALLLRGAGGDRVAGTLVFFLPVLVTWVVDTAAFFGGRRWGRRPLAPTISPNKTVEGALAALAAGPLTAVLYRAGLLEPLAPEVGLGPAGAAVVGLGVAVAAIGGDLLESALKRECGAKDASDLLPGHGGLLDRMDSLLWTIPVAYALLLLLESG